MTMRNKDLSYFSVKKKKNNNNKTNKRKNLKPPTQTCKNHFLGQDDKQSNGHTVRQLD